jgi:hypothetical protein
MPRIFISYRREDSELITGRIYDHLASHFGSHNVFRDLDSILFGVDFRKNISEAVGNCDVLLVMIGEQWLAVCHREGAKQGQRRLDDPDDFVRIEVGSALARGIPVIPVLVDGARMPGEPELPEGLKELAYRNATEVGSGQDFRGHVVRLIRGIEGVAWSRRAWAGRKAKLKAVADDLRHYLARPRRLPLAAGAVAALFLLGVAAWLIIAATRDTSPGVAGTLTPSTESSALLPLKGWVDVRVWEGKKVAGPRNPHRRGLYLHQLDALPLKVNDEIQVEAELTQPMFVYVVWINSAGQALPVYPWRNFKWDQRPAEEQAVARLKLPEGAIDDGWEMDEGAPGMETLLLVARATKLTDEGEKGLKAALAEIGPQPLQDGKSDAAVWFENGAVVTAEKGRAPKSYDAQRIDDPVLRTQGVLRDRLVPHFEYTRAVSFAFRGR